MPPTKNPHVEKDAAGGGTSTRLTAPQFAALGSAAGTFVVGLLAAVGVTGPFVSALTLALLIATFVGSAVKVLQEPWRKAGRRVRAAYVAGVAGCTALLIVVAVAAREAAPLPTMSGTSDVAVIGYLAPSEAEQDDYDDLADSLTDALQPGGDGDSRNYTSSADAPLGELRAGGGSEELDAWVEDFQRATRAELVVAGRAERGGAGQVVVQTLVYVPARMVYDAAELVGWYVLDDSLLDRSLTSAQTRSTLVGHVTDAFTGLSAFLTGLDAWQAGNAAGALDALDVAVERAGDGSTLGDIARLFRGHALETLATGTSGPERADLLSKAARDYAAIRTGSPVQERAELSAATNAYLAALDGGCANADTGALAASSEVLAAVADADTVPEIARRKAQVNRAQVESCRVEAGEESAETELDLLLADLTTLPVPADDDTGELLAQVKALALSIQAVRLVGSDRVDDGIDAMGQALALEPRFERQAIWRALRSAWLLQSCQVDAGQAEQVEALRQLDAAVKAGRQPQEMPSAYASAFADDLARARATCPSSQTTDDRG